jgi:DNA polymerase-3 subunit beta
MFDVNDDNMVVNVDYQNGKFNIPGQSGDAYPQQKPLKEEAIAVLIESQVLLNGISRSIFAVAEDELRPVMNGIFFDFHPDNLTIVASDGHKLMRLRDFSVRSEATAAFILPRKPANLLKMLLSKNSEGVTLSFDDNNAYLKTASFEMVCRLIEGRYPNYNAVIPENNPLLATVDRLSLLAAIKRVSVFSSQASGLIKLHLSENQMIIYAQDIDFSTSGEEMVACLYEADSLDIGFKASCLVDILTNISSDQVVLQLADPSRAGILVPAENKENEDLLMLLVPLMLTDY